MDELKEAIKVIEDLRRQDPCLQRSRNRELTGSFATFWNSKPSIDVFTKQTDGLLFTNWMIYYMTQNPIYRSDKPPVGLSELEPELVKPILATVPEVVTVLTQQQVPTKTRRRRTK